MKEVPRTYFLRNAKYAFKLAILTFSLVMNLIGNWEFKIMGTQRTTENSYGYGKVNASKYSYLFLIETKAGKTLFGVRE